MKMNFRVIYSVALTLLVFQPLSGFGWQDDGYSHDADGGSYRTNANWMGNVHDSTPLTYMSIPGTHDSGTWKFKVIGDDSIIGIIAKTQTMSIERQLQAGIRALDIRCRHENYNSCILYHGNNEVGVNLGQDLWDVLTKVTDFLRDHPTEAVLLLMNNADVNGSGPTDGGPTSPGNRQFANTLKDFYWNSTEYGEYFWKGVGSDQNLPTPAGKITYKNVPHVPTMGDVRGKMVIIQNFGFFNYANDNWDDNNPGVQWPGWYGLPGNRWTGLGHIVENVYWSLSSNWDLYNKWEKVINQLILANSAARTGHIMYYNGLSGSGGALPYFVASGKSSYGTYDPLLLTGRCCGDPIWPDFPRVGPTENIAFLGTNILANKYIQQNFSTMRAPRVGLIMADFPDLALIENVIKLNRNTSPALQDIPTGWCIHTGSHVLAGDFDGDGQIDRLCYDDQGSKWIDYKGNTPDWYVNDGWCVHPGSAILVGDFNGDGRDDLVCHDSAGANWVRLTDSQNHPGDTSWSNSGWCGHPGAELFVADYDGDGRADLLCDDHTGAEWTLHATQEGVLLP